MKFGIWDSSLFMDIGICTFWPSFTLCLAQFLWGVFGFNCLWILGFVLFSQVLPYVKHNAYGVEFWILDLRFDEFLDLCFLAHLLPPKCTMLFHFDSKLEVMSLWLHYSNGLRGSISK